MSPECTDALLVAEPADPSDAALVAAAHGALVLTLGPAILPGRLRLAQRYSGAPNAADGRLVRLLGSIGARLTPDQISAACARLGMENNGAGPCARPADSVDALGALAAGREVVAVGAGGLSDVGLAHAAATEADVPAALAAAEDAPRNHRDTTRRLVAAEVMFNALPQTAEAIGDAVSEAVFALVPFRPATVAVVINTYNYARFLPDAIESVLAQTSAPDEFLVVDDGSTDDTADVLTRFPSVRSIQKLNGGQASALNVGHRETTSEAVIFLDADDRLTPGAVKSLKRTDLRRAARLSFGLRTIDEHGLQLGLYPTTRSAAEGHLAGPLLARGIFDFMPTSGNVFPRWALDRLLPMPEAEWRICADLLLVLGCAALGPTRHLTEVLGEYRVHGANGFFSLLGNTPAGNEVRLAQRIRAWRDIGHALSDTQPPSSCTARQLRRKAALAGNGLARAAEIVLHRPVRSRMRNLSNTAFGTNGERAVLSAEAERVLSRVDPTDFGGPATWPLLETGDVAELTGHGRGVGILGRGWSKPQPKGAELTGCVGTLGLLLAGPRGDWAVTLRVAVDEERRPQIDIWCNGTRIDSTTVDIGGGAIHLRLAGDLLRFDETLGGYVCGLGLLTNARPVHLASVAVARLVMGSKPAPNWPLGRNVAIREGADRCLGAGWGWADAGGVPLLAAEGTLSLSIASPGDHQIILFGEGAWPMITVNGEIAARQAAGPDEAVRIDIPGLSIPRSGALDVGFIRADGTDTSAPFRLRALRLDPVALDVPGFVPPAHTCAASDLLDALHPESSGLAAQASGAVSTGQSFSLPFVCPASDDPLCLSLCLAPTAESACGITLSEPGPPVSLYLGQERVVRLHLPAGRQRTAVISGSAPRGAAPIVFKSLGIEARLPDRPIPEGNNQIITADQLPRYLCDPANWHLAAEEAIWLAAPEGALRLARPGHDIQSIAVQVLTLPDRGQRLTLRLGDAVARTKASGPETIVLPLPDARSTAMLELLVASDALVDPMLLGVSAPQFLGGAICGLRYLTTAPARVAASTHLERIAK